MFRIILFATFIILHTASFCCAENGERITSFHSDIVIHEDSTMTVTETIKVMCLRRNINHGIYRDFPTTYSDEYGNKKYVGFHLLETLRDGKKEGNSISYQSNGVRIYLGDKDVWLKEGEYTYTIKYKTDRQLGFFEDHDELYWNVTGTGWMFPIDSATATIFLPEPISRESLKFYGYTGSQGARDQNFTVTIDKDSNPNFYTTKNLDAYEGLTIVVTWPKGYITEPSKGKLFVEDNINIIYGLIGFIVMLLYYISIWNKVGKDPRKGVIIPLFKPPVDLSPASVRFISQMGYDNKSFAAAVINMAVKGVLTITETKAKYKLTKKSPADLTVLSVEEKQIFDLLFRTADSIEVKQVNHTTFSNCIYSLKTNLKNRFEKVYFFTNIHYFVVGLLLSIVAAVFACLNRQAEKTIISVFLIIWLSVWSFGTFMLLAQVRRLWKIALETSSNFIIAVVVTVIAFPFLIAQIAGVVIFIVYGSFKSFLILSVLISTNVLFYYLLKAPTILGRKIMDQIEGFKMFLSVAEKDRLNILNPPEKTPELFEKYLPYALALDVEQQWAEKFSDVLKAAEVGGHHYAPTWYVGSSWNEFGASGFSTSFGSAFAGAIASSSVAPGSSSGSGGGCSGGGGGGGGGGGW